MDEQFDFFPTNMFERKNFYFHCSCYRVWNNGEVIHQGNNSFDVVGIVTDKILEVVVKSHLLDKYTISQFNLCDISLSGNRILWSAFTDDPLWKVPTALSLFYRNKALVRVSITVEYPQLLIEMDGSSFEL